jgi:hypothetical protein
MFVWRFWSRAGKVSGRSGTSQQVAGDLARAAISPGTAPGPKALRESAKGRNSGQDASGGVSASYVYVDNFPDKPV